jgi:hypothetical protein
MSRSKGNGGGEVASVSWPVTVIEGGKTNGPDLKTALEWFYRSVIALLLGILVYTFQKMDRKVDDLTSRVPALEERIAAMKEQQSTQNKQLGLIVEWIQLQPKPRVKR